MTLTPTMRTWILNHFYRQSTVTSPSGLYLALFTVRPNQDGTGGTEVAGGSYARQSVSLSAAGANDAALDFTNMPACTVVAGGLYDAVSGGNLMQHERFSVPRAVQAGKVFTVPIGDVVVEFD